MGTWTLRVSILELPHSRFGLRGQKPSTLNPRGLGFRVSGFMGLRVLKAFGRRYHEPSSSRSQACPSEDLGRTKPV